MYWSPFYKDHGVFVQRCVQITLALACCHVVNVQGQEAGSVDLGGFELIPMLNYGLSYDDNVTRAADTESDSWVSTLSPEFILLNNFGENRLQFGYRLSRGDYFSTDEDDYTDHLLTSSLEYAFTSRHHIALSAQYHDGHDDRGTVYSIGRGDELAEVDRFENTEVEATYRYGASSAAAGLELSLAARNIDYDRSEPIYLARDRDLQTFTASFFYRLAPRTDLVLDLGVKDVSYDQALEPANPLDSDETRALIGVRWESTAATTGFAKIGYQKKEFDSELREEFSGVDWQIGVDWEPVDHTKVTFSTQRDTNETNGEGNFIESKVHRLNWRYNWLERLATHTGVELRKDTYEQSADVRKDDVTQLRVGAEYQFRRWLTFDLSYLFEDRDSNRPAVVYDRNLLSLSVKVTL